MFGVYNWSATIVLFSKHTLFLYFSRVRVRIRVRIECWNKSLFRLQSRTKNTLILVADQL